MLLLEERMLSTLERNENYVNNEDFYSDRNSDHDFGVVLDEFATDGVNEYIFRYSDGKEESFLFDS